MDGISEAASENTSPAKRGRPRAFDPEFMAMMASLSTARTQRGRQEFAYSTRAISVLDFDPRFHWLTSSREEIDAGTGRMRHGILAELGRVANDDDLRMFALALCKRKPKTKRAVAIIRNWRLGKDGRGDALALANTIINTVNDYLAQHPGMSWDEVQDAMRTAAGQIGERAADRPRKRGRPGKE